MFHERMDRVELVDWVVIMVRDVRVALIGDTMPHVVEKAGLPILIGVYSV